MSRLGIQKLSGKSMTPMRYNSASTRHSTLQAFMGGAEIAESHAGVQKLSCEIDEDLESKFKSKVNRTDCVRAWGVANVVRQAAGTRFDIANDAEAWIRRNGEPLYEK